MGETTPGGVDVATGGDAMRAFTTDGPKKKALRGEGILLGGDDAREVEEEAC